MNHREAYSLGEDSTFSVLYSLQPHQPTPGYSHDPPMLIRQSLPVCLYHKLLAMPNMLSVSIDFLILDI